MSFTKFYTPKFFISMVVDLYCGHWHGVPIRGNTWVTTTDWHWWLQSPENGLLSQVKHTWMDLQLQKLKNTVSSFIPKKSFGLWGQV